MFTCFSRLLSEDEVVAEKIKKAMVCKSLIFIDFVLCIYACLLHIQISHSNYPCSLHA